MGCSPFKFSFAVLFFYLLTLGAQTGWAVDESRTFTIYADTDLKDPRYGSFIQARRDNIHLKDLDHLTLITKDGVDLLASEKTDASEVILFMPADLDKADQDAFVSAVEDHLNHGFGTRILTVKRSYLPVSLLENGQEVETEKRLQTWAQRTKEIARSLRLHAAFPEDVDLTLGTVVGGLRSIAGVGYWLSATGLNMFGASQSALTLMLNYMFTRYPTQINLWKSEHMFPFFEDNFFVQFYNSHAFVKTMAMNEVIAYVVQSSFRMFSHLADPTKIPSAFSLQFIKGFFGVGMIRSVLSAAEDNGGIVLLKKGYLSQRAVKYLFLFFGAESQLNAFLYSSGQVRWLPLSFIVEALSRSVVWLLAEFLPAKHNRLFILHPNINPQDQDQVEYVNDLRNLYLTDSTVSQHTLKELIRKHNWKFEGPPPAEPEDDRSLRVSALHK